MPSDTLWGNTQLSAPLVDCLTFDTTGAGIVVWNKDRALLIGCKATRAGRGGPVPTTEDGAVALRHAGIGFSSVKTVSLIGCSAQECGAAGLVTRFCGSVKDTDGEWSKNGQVLTASVYKAGVYSEGTSGSATKLTLINPVMDGGTTQYQPVRVILGHPDSVALDPEFVNHTSASLGVTTKKLISI